MLNTSTTPVHLAFKMISSMVSSIYRTRKHGIRIEKLVLTVQDEKNEFRKFYTLDNFLLALVDTIPVKNLKTHHVKRMLITKGYLSSWGCIKLSLSQAN